MGMTKFSKTFKFTDVNYLTADLQSQKKMYKNYQDLLSLLDEECDFKTTIINRKLNKLDFENKIKIPIKNDELTNYRKELNDILAKSTLESQGVIQEKYFTITIDRWNVDDARKFFNRIYGTLKNSFAKLNSELTPLNLNER